MILQIKKGLYDVYKNPSETKKKAYYDILLDIEQELESYIVITSGNKFTFSVYAIDPITPLAITSKGEIYPAIKYTKNGKSKHTFKLL